MASNKEPNSFVFAAILCVACSLVLATVATVLKPMQEKNVEIDKQRNILKAMGVLESARKYSSSDIERVYQEKIQNRYVTNEGDIVTEKTDNPIFIYEANGTIKKYAIPTAGYGLWSWIYGFIALEGDGETVAGLSIYKHGETPGLGGEVEKEWFTKQFIGKEITNDEGEFVSIGIVKGKVKDVIPEEDRENYVDGMSGATITSKGMESSLKENLTPYEPFSKKLRSGLI